MSYKAKRINDNKKKKEPKDPNKFHLGRNLGTYLIMIGGIIGLLLIIGAIVLTVQFIKVNTGNKVYPYQDEDHQELIIDPVFVEYKDFQLFDVKLEAVSMDTHDAKKATFDLYVIKNENTPELIPIRYSSNTFTKVADSTYRAYASICVAADKVGVCNYSSSYSYITKSSIESTFENTTKKTISVSFKDGEEFPMKAEGSLIPVTVNTPEAYVLLVFLTEEKGNEVLNFYVIHFSYDDYYVTGKTSPAI